MRDSRRSLAIRCERDGNPQPGDYDSKSGKRVDAVGRFEGALRPCFHPRPRTRNGAASRKARHLHPRCLLFLAEIAFEVEAPSFAAAKLSAGSFWNGLRPKQLDGVRRHAHRLAHGLRNFAGDAFRGGHVAHFRGDD